MVGTNPSSKVPRRRSRFFKRREKEDAGTNVEDGFSRQSSLSGFALFQLLRSALLGGVITLYVLNQQHMLPKPLSAVVSKVLFWPTLPITVLRRIGQWETVVDDTVLIGGAPFAPWMPLNLYENHGVRGVINLCEEYSGPERMYDSLGVQQLRLMTVDHFEPSLEDMKEAMSFIEFYREKGDSVYIHCKAGHGRSAAITLCWLIYNYPDTDLQELNQRLCNVRNVRSTLYQQTNIRAFHRWVQGSRRGNLGNRFDHNLWRDIHSSSHTPLRNEETDDYYDYDDSDEYGNTDESYGDDRSDLEAWKKHYKDNYNKY